MTNTYDFKKKDIAKLNALGAVLGAEPAPDPLTITEEDHALAIIPPTNLVVMRPPKEQLLEAKEVSDALVEIVKASPDLTIELGGHQYLKFEAWQMIGKFFGCSPKITETKYLEMGEVKGFEAKASVVNSSGIEISAAEAMCLSDEPKWGMRPKYKWENRQKVKVGEEPTPLFQLKSMAQTRASAKALRNVFAWVVVLAGYKPTPAEEMDGVRPSREQETASWETVEGIIDQPRLSGGSLWFLLKQYHVDGDKWTEKIFTIPPMVGKDMKLLLQEADKASVELKVTPLTSTKGGKEYQIVKEILKFEPDVPF